MEHAVAIICACIPAIASVIAAKIKTPKRNEPVNSIEEREKLIKLIKFFIVGIGMTMSAIILVITFTIAHDALRKDVEIINNRLEFLSPSEYISLWGRLDETEGSEDLSEKLPQDAKAVVLSVGLRLTEKLDTSASSYIAGSNSAIVVCADNKDNFYENNDSNDENEFLVPYLNPSLSNFSDDFISGMLICPISSQRKFFWRIVDNQGNIRANEKIDSYASVIGYF